MNNYYNPFFRYRYPRFPFYYNNHINKINNQQSHTKQKGDTFCAEEKSQTESSFKNTNNSHCQSKKNDNKLNINSFENPLIEFHGIQLYSDDLLILSLIFFLYKENITDSLLYIALFALLFF